MNYNTIQKKIFAKLLSGARICYTSASEDGEIGLTDGYVMYIIPKTKLAISMEKMSALKTDTDILSEKPEDRQVKSTGNMKSLINGVAVQYKCNEFEIWMNEKFFKEFKGCKFFAHSPHGRILVKTMFDEKIGVIMPVRMKNEE